MGPLNMRIATCQTAGCVCVELFLGAREERGHRQNEEPGDVEGASCDEQLWHDPRLVGARFGC